MHVNAEGDNAHLEVDEEWLDGVNDLEHIDTLELDTIPNEQLLVGYSYGKNVLYENIHGTWGNPITLI